MLLLRTKDVGVWLRLDHCLMNSSAPSSRCTAPHSQKTFCHPTSSHCDVFILGSRLVTDAFLLAWGVGTGEGIKSPVMLCMVNIWIHLPCLSQHSPLHVSLVLSADHVASIHSRSCPPFYLYIRPAAAITLSPPPPPPPPLLGLAKTLTAECFDNPPSSFLNGWVVTRCPLQDLALLNET